MVLSMRMLGHLCYIAMFISGIAWSERFDWCWFKEGQKFTPQKISFLMFTFVTKVLALQVSDRPTCSKLHKLVYPKLMAV
jgi:hypothetical protein